MQRKANEAQNNEDKSKIAWDQYHRQYSHQYGVQHVPHYGDYHQSHSSTEVFPAPVHYVWDYHKNCWKVAQSILVLCIFRNGRWTPFKC